MQLNVNKFVLTKLDPEYGLAQPQLVHFSNRSKYFLISLSLKLNDLFYEILTFVADIAIKFQSLCTIIGFQADSDSKEII